MVQCNSESDNMNYYESLSEEAQKKVRELTGFDGSELPKPVRRDMSHDRANLWRPAYVRDVEKIMHSPYYNRYTDKTQVFSFYKNDDISRRGFHVQLVSRIARNIGRLLGLNLDLIEAIALGHDIGHTPFGHAGERFLNELYHNNTGRYFNHNAHSVRVLDGIFNLNLTLQTLDGILCHNGEFECREYRPEPLDGFGEFDKKTEACYTDRTAVERLVPSTLEGCVVRVCDMIAYLGKDRQDAVKARLIEDENVFGSSPIGSFNAAIINNLIVDLVENSVGKDFIMLDKVHFDAVKSIKRENYEKIYFDNSISDGYDNIIKPMFARVYNSLLDMLKRGDRSSVIYRHHIDFVNSRRSSDDYEKTEPNQIVTDYMASMTDDYFIDLYEFLFGVKSGIEYKSYFDDMH